MNTTEFNQVLEDQIQRCKDTLIKKGDEYATEDRLHNFHAGAGLCQRSPEEVCASFMLKHIVSIYDMCRDASAGKSNPLTVWNEKLGDAINYMLLLSAIVRESEPALDPKIQLFRKQYPEQPELKDLIHAAYAASTNAESRNS